MGEDTKAKIVYIVDDDPLITRALRRGFIGKYGDAVVIMMFGSAEQALAAMRSAQPDLLVTDLEMDGMRGDALREEARRLHPRLPVILHTGNHSEYERLRAGTLGARDRVFAKPTPLAVYVAAIDELLGEG